MGAQKTQLLLLQALHKYTIIARDYSDLALAERARVKRALMLYETGQVEQALLELEDEEVALRGNAEVPPHNHGVHLVTLSKTKVRRIDSAKTYCNYPLRAHALAPAQVHAAMAAVLYAEKPLERQRAELQWEIGTEFDSRYNNIEWVARSKVWGPRLLQALERFLTLQ